MDLIHPHTKADVADALRDASEHGRRVLVVGGRTHMDKGNPVDVDAELWTTMLDAVIAYEPAEMIAVVEAGMRVGELQRLLAQSGQEWPCDAPADSTVGGVIAAGVCSPRRLRTGSIRDTVLEMELVTGDGRLIKSGARTVKSVTGYQIHKLAAGSLGTLAVIVQVALKLRPVAAARHTIRVPGGLEAAGRLLVRSPVSRRSSRHPMWSRSAWKVGPKKSRHRPKRLGAWPLCSTSPKTRPSRASGRGMKRPWSLRRRFRRRSSPSS